MHVAIHLCRWIAGRVHHVVGLIAASFLLAAPLPSHAFTNYEYSWANYTGYGTCAAVGAHYAAWETTNTTSTVTFEGCLTSPAGSAPWYTHVRLHYYADSNGSDQGAVNRQINFRVVQACPANSTGTSGNCTCNSGFTQTTSADGTHSCVDLQAAACGAIAGQPPNSLTCTGSSCAYYSAGSYQTSACVPSNGNTTQGCLVSGDLDVAWKTNEAGTEWGVRITNVKYTGAKCDTAAAPVPGAGSTPTKEANLQPPNQGKCPGTVNGVEIWVPCTTTVSERKTTDNKTTTNPDGTTTTSTEGKTSTTECKAGVCTTTTTTTTTVNNNTTTTTGTSTKPKSAYCAESPSDPQCDGEEDSAFAGSCSAGFECRGDAVQCAVAREQHERNCSMFKFDDADVQKGTEARTKDIPSSFWSTINLSSVLPSKPVSSCPFTSQAITVGEGVLAWSVPLDLSQVCPYIEKIRAIVVSFGAVMFALIVLGRK